MKTSIVILFAFLLAFTACQQEEKVVNRESEPLIPELVNMELDNPVLHCDYEGAEVSDSGKDEKGYLKILFLGLIGGLVSLFTPCVFPMIPLTVSFFTKGGKDKGGIAKAVLYGVSIIAVYCALSIPFYFGADSGLLNGISTSAPLNIVFFLIFLVFAFSFFGYYELTLPASWANKADKAADFGGFFGIVFMALVLAIVSFSCTGPLLGSVLAGSLTSNFDPLLVTFAMLGFGLGLGLPFALLAAFPSVMKKMPQSGGWLNSVKVVLGFVELALALKFLSNADFVYQKGIVLRETFFLIWIIVAFATALYLFGFIRFKMDVKGAKLSLFRKSIGVLFLVFGIYLIPGLFPKESQPWRTGLVSGFPPSEWYSWYGGEKHFTNYFDGLEYAKETGKPMLIDFTGYACVNCRRMEESVWVEDRVKKLLDEYVIVSLYVDDKNESEVKGSYALNLSDGTVNDKQIVTTGDRWSTFEASKFFQVSQPFYVLLSPEEYLLNDPVAYTPDAGVYADWLECGLSAMTKVESGEYSLTGVEAVNTLQDNVRIKWTTSVEKIEGTEDEYFMVANGDIEKDWHTYSHYLEGLDGPASSWMTLPESDQYTLLDSIIESESHEYFDTIFDMNVKDFSNEVEFKQRIKVSGQLPISIKGNVNAMACKDGACEPPTDYPLEFKINE